MSRKIGEILIDEFRVPESRIREALSTQSAAGEPRRRLGSILRGTREKAEPADNAQIALALLIQHSEQSRAGSRSAAREFDSVEYVELGEMIRDERRFIDNKVRSYVAILAGLVLYIAYPLNLVLANPEARPSEWPGLLVLYSALGIAFVVVSLFAGDSTVKSYGTFLKRRTRIAMARRQLRAVHCAAGDLTPTVMPMREAVLRDVPVASVPERPDPEITGFQKKVPIHFALWSFLKLGLMLYFTACLVGMTFKITPKELKIALAITLVAALAWAHFLAMLCERYHTTLRELTYFSNDNPFPRVSTTALRVDARYQGVRWMTFAWHAGTAGVIIAIGVYQWQALHKTDDGLLWAMGIGTGVHVAGRVVDVLDRVRRAKVGPVATKT